MTDAEGTFQQRAWLIARSGKWLEPAAIGAGLLAGLPSGHFAPYLLAFGVASGALGMPALVVRSAFAKHAWLRKTQLWAWAPESSALRFVLGVSALLTSLVLGWPWWRAYVGSAGYCLVLQTLAGIFGGASSALSTLRGRKDPSAKPQEIAPHQVSFRAAAPLLLRVLFFVPLVGMPVLLAAIVLNTRPLPSSPYLWASATVFAQILLILAVGAAARFWNVDVGLDGVAFRVPFGRRFFAYAELDGARLNGPYLELVRSREVVGDVGLEGDGEARVRVLMRVLERMAQAKAAAVARGAHVFAEAAPAQLAEAVASGGDYRAASVSRQDLWSLVEGAGASALARRAAVGALARTGDVEERAHLRVAVERCADPLVRQALDEVEREDAQDPAVAPSPAHARVP